MLPGQHLSANAAGTPALLDHLILGCNDLDHGIAFVEAHTGVRAAFGGVHPGAGTRNALLSLGRRRYLEILAPDPAQPDTEKSLKALSGPRLLTWAAHLTDLDALARRLREAGIAFEGPTSGSRKRPNGLVLQWRTLMLKDDAAGLLPFFIEWSAASVHPSADSPRGCTLARLDASTSDPDALARQGSLLGLDLAVVSGDKPQLRATLIGPKGRLDIAS